MIDPHTLIKSGTIMRCGFAGVGIAFLEQASSVWPGFEVSHAQNTAQRLGQLPVARKTYNSQLLLLDHIFLHAAMLPMIMITG